MNKISLADWASIAEVVGAIGVVVSLLFVVQSINRNTAALATNAESEFLSAWRNAVQIPFNTNERLAEIQLKVHTRQQLTPIESKMWENSLHAACVAVTGTPEQYSKSRMGSDWMHWRIRDPEGNAV